MCFDRGYGRFCRPAWFRMLMLGYTLYVVNLLWCHRAHFKQQPLDAGCFMRQGMPSDFTILPWALHAIVSLVFRVMGVMDANSDVANCMSAKRTSKSTSECMVNDQVRQLVCLFLTCNISAFCLGGFCLPSFSQLTAKGRPKQFGVP